MQAKFIVPGDDLDRIAIGIDVGWSKKRRTCAFAAQGLNVEVAGIRTWTFASPVRTSRNVCVSVFTLEELTAFLAILRNQLRHKLDRMTIVIDGPLGADAPPTQRRHVDSECGRGGFNGRAQPSPVDNELGRVYVDATYRIAAPLLEAAGGNRPWMGGAVPSDRFLLAETNPTVAMALMLPPQPVSDLPSRRRPRSLLSEDRLVRAKSDWYWALGVNQQVSEILAIPELKHERDHERVAGVFCLALAAQLADTTGHDGAAVAIGDKEGIYVVSRQLAAGWERDVERVGIASGSPRFVARKCAAENMTQTPRIPEQRLGPIPTNEGTSDELEIYEKGDVELPLWLCDGGGVWERHNDWLAGNEPMMCLQATDGAGGQIRLSKAEGQGQWKCEPTTTSLARSRGLPQGESLSKSRAYSIPVRVVEAVACQDRVNPDPCCGQPVQNYFRGRYCRCCGTQLQTHGTFVVGCNRQHSGLAPCPYCNQNTCGPHSHNTRGQWPVRRYCEICGERCDKDGGCPQHGMAQA